jgi:RND family efflux transporter MFP subunit
VELREKGAASPQEFDVAKAEMQATRAAWAQADQALKDSVIRAPYDGTILARLANPGETISPGNPVLKVANLERMSAELGVPEKLVGSIQIGKEIPLRVPALDALSFTGRISEVGVAAKEGARLFKVLMKLDNPNHLLKSGMTASVVLSEAAAFPPGSVLVPLSALVASSKPDATASLAVFVVEADGKARERAVCTDEIVRSSILITAGLKPGEQVVTVGAGALYDGAPVDARPAESR